MNNPLVYEYRGDLLDNMHHGDICVIDAKGNISHQVGNPLKEVYFRSSSKPFQVIPLLLLGGEKAFNLTQQELVIMAASQVGQPEHIKIVKQLAEKVGILEEELIMLPTYPGDPKENERYIREGIPKGKLYHNCIGKHICSMLVARLLGEKTADYWKVDSGVQQKNLALHAYLSDTPVEDIHTGLDGCGVPVFSSTLQGIAKAYQFLALPEKAEDSAMVEALTKMQQGIAKYPYLIRGKGYFCGEINTDPEIVAKGGANGVYGLASKKTGVAVSFRMEDGGEETLPLVLATVLEQLGIGAKTTWKTIADLAGWSDTNSAGQVAVTRKTMFQL